MADQARLPWSGRFPGSAHTSHLGAVQAAETFHWKSQRYLAFVRERRCVTDEETSLALGITRNAICSIRNDLVTAGTITQDGFRHFERVEGGKLRHKTHALWRLTTETERQMVRLRQQE